MARITKSLQLNETDDADILAWFNTLKEGQGQAALKAVIRAGIATMNGDDGGGGGGQLPTGPAPAPFDAAAFTSALLDGMKDGLINMAPAIGTEIGKSVAGELQKISIPIYTNGNGHGADDEPAPVIPVYDPMDDIMSGLDDWGKQ